MRSPNEISGRLEITEYLKATGEVVGHYEDNNVILESGVNDLFGRLIASDASNNKMISNFVLGSDFGETEDPGGGWTSFNPLMAEKTYTSANQDSIYSVPEFNMVINYPDLNVVQYGTILDGDDILTNDFPGEISIQYSSLTTRFRDGASFAFKRFPVRSLSRVIFVQISWTFDWQPAQDVVC